MKLTIEKTLKDNLCINCGLCRTVCKFDAIKMVRNKYGEINPIIDKEKCKNCGQCLRVCPMEKDKLLSIAECLSNMEEPHTYGLENAKYYAAWDKNDEQRLKCCSGGAITKLASYLMEQGKIDGMIHAERLCGHRGDLHYGIRLSTSAKEIHEHVSSAYQAMDFSEVLMKLVKGKTYFMTGTPCVIRGIKRLLRKHDFDSVKIMTCALVCSHNTNAQFIDFLTEINELCDTDPWSVNIRAKDNTIPDASNFKNFIYTKGGKELLNKNRFDTGWTTLWRSYYFAMNSCIYCPDFWGAEADISVKDAWGKWSDEEPRGTSIVIIRNYELEKDFINSGLGYDVIDYETMKEHQKNTAEYKQTNAIYKFREPVFSKRNRESLFCKYYFMSKCSKFLYKKFGFKISYFIMKVINFVLNIWRMI